MKKYQSNGKIRVPSPEVLRRLIAETNSSYYVYVLCLPPAASEMVPFYVGIGQLNRLFAHEEEAGITSSSNRKVEQIRRIWKDGDKPIRVIDGFFDDPPWVREEELINAFGLKKDGSGILTNEQRYSPSFHICEICQANENLAHGGV